MLWLWLALSICLGSTVTFKAALSEYLTIVPEEGQMDHPLVQLVRLGHVDWEAEAVGFLTSMMRAHPKTLSRLLGNFFGNPEVQEMTLLNTKNGQTLFKLLPELEVEAQAPLLAHFMIRRDGYNLIKAFPGLLTPLHDLAEEIGLVRILTHHKSYTSYLRGVQKHAVGNYIFPLMLALAKHSSMRVRELEALMAAGVAVRSTSLVLACLESRKVSQRFLFRHGSALMEGRFPAIHAEIDAVVGPVWPEALLDHVNGLVSRPIVHLSLDNFQHEAAVGPMAALKSITRLVDSQHRLLTMFGKQIKPVLATAPICLGRHDDGQPINPCLLECLLLALESGKIRPKFCAISVALEAKLDRLVRACLDHATREMLIPGGSLEVLDKIIGRFAEDQDTKQAVFKLAWEDFITRQKDRYIVHLITRNFIDYPSQYWFILELVEKHYETFCRVAHAFFSSEASQAVNLYGGRQQRFLEAIIRHARANASQSEVFLARTMLRPDTFRALFRRPYMADEVMGSCSSGVPWDYALAWSQGDYQRYLGYLVGWARYNDCVELRLALATIKFLEYPDYC